MTSKQIKKIPISVFFSYNQIPKNYEKIIFDEYSSYSVFKSSERVLVNLSKISNLNNLQKNFKLILIGQAVKKICKKGNFFVDYFGCEKTDIKNFYLGWSLADYAFEKYKSKKKKKLMPKFFMNMKKK